MSASRKVSVWLLIILLPAVAYLGWYNYRQFTRGQEELAGVVEKPKWRFANEENWLVDGAAGVQSGDVIVAIDGYRVRNINQYIYARGLASEPKFQLIVWNAQGYRELSANIPGRRLNAGLGNYRKK